MYWSKTQILRISEQLEQVLTRQVRGKCSANFLLYTDSRFGCDPHLLRSFTPSFLVSHIVRRFRPQQHGAKRRWRRHHFDDNDRQQQTMESGRGRSCQGFFWKRGNTRIINYYATWELIRRRAVALRILGR
jgi:hypothetical protein